MRALVIGGSGTVGQAVCRTLAAQGARVAFTYHQGEAKAMALAGELEGSLALPLDLTSVADIDTTVAHAAKALGGLDALVHCAGVGVTVEGTPESFHRMAQVDEAAWDRMLAVNTKSSYFAVRAAAPHLRGAGGGNVVLLGSIDGVKPVPAPVHYAASRGAQAALVMTMAKELGKDGGTRVNMVAPGVLEEGLSRTLPEELRAEYEKHCALGRVGTLAEVADLVAWLALENTYVTGRTLVLDGAL
jgi:NAD(P)-dependent dehydrogenase (short-subunit alcohol dehydrogenase family)